MPTAGWFTEAYAINMASNPKDVVELHTLEFNHPSFLVGGVQTPVRLVGDAVNWTLRIESGAPFNAGQDVVFAGIAFDLEESDQTDGAGQQMRVRIDSVGREISQYLDAANEINSAIDVIYRRYLSNAPTVVASGPFRLNLTTLVESSSSIEGALSVARPELASVIRRVFDMTSYPGLLAIA